VYQDEASGAICRGASVVSSPEPSSDYSQDALGAGDQEWYLTQQTTLEVCKATCTGLAGSWGCKYISFGDGWCYVHKTCEHKDADSDYNAYAAPTTAPAATGAPPDQCSVGQSVTAQYGNGGYYDATIESISGSTVTVNWNDGDTTQRSMDISKVKKNGVVCTL
jgi:hypothetical protein